MPSFHGFPPKQTADHEKTDEKCEDEGENENEGCSAVVMCDLGSPPHGHTIVQIDGIGTRRNLIGGGDACRFFACILAVLGWVERKWEETATYETYRRTIERVRVDVSPNTVVAWLEFVREEMSACGRS